MIAKITAFLMAIYLFIAGIPYGNQPNKVEFSYEVINQQAYYEVGDDIRIEVTAKNVGRPFKVNDPGSSKIDIDLFQEIDGETIYLDTSKYVIPAEPRPMIIKNGDVTVTHYSRTLVDELIPGEKIEIVPGVYDMRVEFGGCTQVFEDVITVK